MAKRKEYALNGRDKSAASKRRNTQNWEDEGLDGENPETFEESRKDTGRMRMAKRKGLRPRKLEVGPENETKDRAPARQDRARKRPAAGRRTVSSRTSRTPHSQTSEGEKTSTPKGIGTKIKKKKKAVSPDAGNTPLRGERSVQAKTETPAGKKRSITKKSTKKTTARTRKSVAPIPAAPTTTDRAKKKQGSPVKKTGSPRPSRRNRQRRGAAATSETSKPKVVKAPTPSRPHYSTMDGKEITKRKYAPGEGKAGRRILISTREDQESRVCVVAEHRLEELYVDKVGDNTYLGNIYLGKVVNLEPSIGAAFVDFGEGKNGFLHASDVVPTVVDSRVKDFLDLSEKDSGKAPVRRNDERKNIDELLKMGDEIVVQITKDGIGHRGRR